MRFLTSARPPSHPLRPSLTNDKRSVYVPVETNDKLANDMGIPEEMDNVLERLSSTRPPPVTNLKVIQFSFETLDSTVSHFQVLVESITFCDELQEEGMSAPESAIKMKRTCCSHCLNLASSLLTCSVKRLRRVSSSSLNLGLSDFFTRGSPNFLVSICCWR